MKSMNEVHEPITQKNVASLCRTCMSPDTNTSLFSVLTLSNNKEEPLYSILYKCTSVQVTEADVLPQNICNNCLEKLALCYLFRELSFETQSKLYELHESQKAASYIITSSENVSCLNPYPDNSLNIDSKDNDFIGYNSFKNDIVNISVNIPATEVSPNDPNHLDESQCDFEYLNCDNQNSYEGLDEGEYNNSKKDFTCDTCLKKFDSKYSLNKHKKIHADPAELKCHICLKQFSRATDVRRHLNTHTGEKPYGCVICKCTFTQSGSLAAHMRRKHKEAVATKSPVKPRKVSNDKPYLCSTCGMCFRHSSTLNMHLRRHQGDRSFKCQHCGWSFISSGRLHSHMRIHTGERPFICHICNKNFAHSTALAKHIKIHDNVKPHKCPYCTKTFLMPYDLNIHIRRHTGEKPLRCQICDKSFACPKILKQHSKIHSDEKSYLCINCGKAFRRAQHLRRHNMKLHGKT